jgi:hypothetical protein
LKFPLSVATLIVDSPLPGGPLTGAIVGLGVIDGLGVVTGVGLDVDVGVGEGVGEGDGIRVTMEEGSSVKLFLFILFLYIE